MTQWAMRWLEEPRPAVVVALSAGTDAGAGTLVAAAARERGPDVVATPRPGVRLPALSDAVRAVLHLRTARCHLATLARRVREQASRLPRPLGGRLT
jgi:hypothetical protein